MRYRQFMSFLLLCLTVSMSGCYQSTDVTIHEPGEYKGAKDPLLAYEGTEAQQQKLKERFNLVQTDR